MMTKRLKIITILNCIYIMLSLFYPSLTFGNDRPGQSSPLPTLSEEPERAGRNILPGIPDTTEYFCSDTFSKPAYKPVPDEYPYPDNNGNLLDNFMYKDWCEKTFDNGKDIYEAYKDIAFNIKYTPEQVKTDIWQTPCETGNSKKGDCEDAVFLFLSHFSSIHNNARVQWGWVIDKGSRFGRAHVWSELTGKAGRQYIVEGFSKGWDGIIPLEIVEQTEFRKTIFTITHSEFCRLSRLVSKPDSWQAYQSIIDLCTSANFIESYSRNLNISQVMDSCLNPDYGLIEYLLDIQIKSYKDTISNRYSTRPNVSPAKEKEISNIFRKLHELFLRCQKQKEEFDPNLQTTW
ncbi:transglutaminase-like enzyme, putative cysteine protease [Candidatus Scalindua japonica]|uniref:Transglutaminase-like enzyme, putative cysteine protease n=1 Tax=Candidatus Scalindua japonica TaxID=1284222 RepID=A0A286U1T6_9BACT|nr:hypothetical protein [Candidatus Scalindua japonica]GAX62086.1 transglutaminase-like enzyme, putative cysteine protease [Candidatus Scalindua japonica]